VRDLQITVCHELRAVFTTTSRMLQRTSPTAIPAKIKVTGRRAMLQARQSNTPISGSHTFAGSLFADYIVRQREWEEIIPVVELLVELGLWLMRL
jgi:hypothetical protein